MNTTTNSLTDTGAAVNLPPIITQFTGPTCPDCHSSMTPSQEYVGGRGYMLHWNCTRATFCGFRASDEYMTLHAKDKK
jgi:hypothetical protein